MSPMYTLYARLGGGVVVGVGGGGGEGGGEWGGGGEWAYKKL